MDPHHLRWRVKYKGANQHTKGVPYTVLQVWIAYKGEWEDVQISDEKADIIID
jgi:hypothetical protein